MTLLVIAIAICLVCIIADALNRRAVSISYIEQNRASFVAEVEEYARLSEEIYKEYCGIIGLDFKMPKVVCRSRLNLSMGFYKAFSKYVDVEAIEILRIRYSLPTVHELKFNKSANGLKGEFCIHVDIYKGYYSSLYDIIFLCVYRSLKARGYNFQKGLIYEDKTTEYLKIQEILARHPWLSGDFKRNY